MYAEKTRRSIGRSIADPSVAPAERSAQNTMEQTAEEDRERNGMTACGDGQGSLPGHCASLAFPYVPMQSQNDRRYGQQEALREGTLFPGLNLPFRREMEARFPAVNSALSELMALDFAIDELGLYLNTHRDDEDALELFRSYIRLAKEGREKYVATYGPLLQTDLTANGGYRWLDDPWPWEKGGNN